MKHRALNYDIIPKVDRDLLEDVYTYRPLPDLSKLSPREYSDLISNAYEQLCFRYDMLDPKNTSEVAILIRDSHSKISCIKQHLKKAQYIAYAKSQTQQDYERLLVSSQDQQDYERSLASLEPPPINKQTFYWQD